MTARSGSPTDGPAPRKRASKRAAKKKASPAVYPATGLAEIGLHEGQQVRFRRSDGERWKLAKVARREKDGSVGLHDAKGAARSIAVSQIEVQGTGPRGGVTWEPLTAVMARTEQMAMVRDDATTRRSARRRAAAPSDAPTSSDGDAAGDDRGDQLRLL